MANRLRNDRSSSERSRLSAKAGPGVKRLSILLLPACLPRYGELWLGRGRGGRAGRRLVAAGVRFWRSKLTRRQFCAEPGCEEAHRIGEAHRRQPPKSGSYLSRAGRRSGANLPPPVEGGADVVRAKALHQRGVGGFAIRKGLGGS